MHHRRAVRSDGTSWAARSSAVLAFVSLVSLVCLVVGAIALAIGATRPTTRTSTVQRPWATSTTFGWSGAAAVSTVDDVYPDGQVQSPQPVFLRLLNDITVTADVASTGVAPTRSKPLTLRATLGDGSGWSRTWALDRTVANSGSPAHLSAPLQLNNLYYEVAWNQVATGVVTPITLTLTVDSGQPATSPHLTFSLDRLLLKPLDSLTTNSGGSVSVVTHAVGTVGLAGRTVSVVNLRKSGAVLLGAGLILAAAATITDRRRRRNQRPEPVATLLMDLPAQRAAIEEIEPETVSL